MRTLLALILILVALPMQADRRGILLSKKTSAAGGGGVTYLIDEQFEGTGAPSNWDTPTGDPADWDFTGTVLEGAQSLELAAGDSVTARYGASVELNNTELWGRMLVRFSESGAGRFLRLYSAGDAAEVGTLYRNADGTILVFAGGATDTTTEAAANGTTYYVWWHWKKGTGTDAIMEVWFSTTSTRPADGSNFHAKEIDGTATANCARIHLVNVGGITDNIQDDIKVAAQTFE